MEPDPISRARLQKASGVLAGCFLFRGFSEAEIAGLLARPGVGRLRFRKGDVILAEEAAPPALYILLRGGAVVEKRSGEGLLRMNTLEPGALLGLATLFAGEDARFPTRVSATKDCELIAIPEDVLRELLRADFRLTENYIRYLAGRVRFLNAQIEGLVCPTAEQRLLMYLTRHAENGRLTQGLTALAQSVGVSRASLYRALEKLGQDGAIRRAGRTIELLQAKAPDNLE